MQGPDHEGYGKGELRLWIPNWLARLFAPRLAQRLEARSAVTGKASEASPEISLLFGWLTIQAVAQYERDGRE